MRGGGEEREIEGLLGTGEASTSGMESACVRVEDFGLRYIYIYIERERECVRKAKPSGSRASRGGRYLDKVALDRRTY